MGIFVSIDGGSTWLVENTGFTNTVVENLVINKVNTTTSLFAFTHGRGAWKTVLNTTNSNTAPVASNGTLAVVENTPASGTLSATDADANSLTYSIVSNGSKGTAAITNTTTGAYTYTPTAGQTGQDTFTFKVNDGTVDSNTATITLSISASVSNGGSGGGSFGMEVLLLLLASLIFISRSRKTG